VLAQIEKPVTSQGHLRGENTVKIQVSSIQEIDPMRIGKRVRTSLKVGELYQSPEDFLKAWLMSDLTFDDFYVKSRNECQLESGDLLDFCTTTIDKGQICSKNTSAHTKLLIKSRINEGTYNSQLFRCSVKVN